MKRMNRIKEHPMETLLTVCLIALIVVHANFGSKLSELDRKSTVVRQELVAANDTKEKLVDQQRELQETVAHVKKINVRDVRKEVSETVNHLLDLRFQVNNGKPEETEKLKKESEKLATKEAVQTLFDARSELYEPKMTSKPAIGLSNLTRKTVTSTTFVKFKSKYANKGDEQAVLFEMTYDIDAHKVTDVKLIGSTNDESKGWEK